MNNASPRNRRSQPVQSRPLPSNKIWESRSPSRLLRVPPREDIKKDWGTSFNILFGGEAPPERGNFFKFQVDEKVGISLVEVNERVMKSVIARKL